MNGPSTVRDESPRILLSAYQCGPGMGSVSQIGWEWYQRLSRRLPVTLITHVRNRDALARAGVPITSPALILVDTERFARPLYRLARLLFPRDEHAIFMISSLDFFAYDRAALQIVRQRVAAGDHWDLVHAVTPVSTLAATRLHELGFPLILGPLNCGLATPRGCGRVLGGDSRWLYPLRKLGRIADRWFGTTSRAAAILVANRLTMASLPPSAHARCITMIENGVDLDLFPAAPWPELRIDREPLLEPLQVLFVGRLLSFKGLPLLLEAVARVRNQFALELTVIGEGPMAKRWQEEARRRHLGDIVHFRGALPLAAIAEALRSVHVLCLPSIRESGGAVLLEAMAVARPVIAVAFGGPAEVVDDAVGRAIPLTNPEGVIAAIADALRDIVQNPDAWRRRGMEGCRRAWERYSWEAKIARAIRLYSDLLEHENVRVGAAMPPARNLAVR